MIRYEYSSNIIKEKDRKMGAMNWYQMYEIDTSTIWHEAIGAENISESCYSELLSQFESLMLENKEKYTSNIDKEEYDVQRHFHFVRLCERYWNHDTNKKLTNFQKVHLGYVVRANNSLGGLKYKSWKNQIEEVLKKQLPDIIKGNDIETTRLLADENLLADSSQEEREEWIQYQMTRHAPHNIRLCKDDVEEAYRWTYDIYWFRHSRIILTYKNDDIDEKRYFTFFFAWAVAVLDLEQLDALLK